MPIVNAVVTAAKLTSATYRIVATTVMGYYLVKGVVDYERQRRKESKRVLHPNTKFAFVDEGSKK